MTDDEADSDSNGSGSGLVRSDFLFVGGVLNRDKILRSGTRSRISANSLAFEIAPSYKKAAEMTWEAFMS